MGTRRGEIIKDGVQNVQMKMQRVSDRKEGAEDTEEEKNEEEASSPYAVIAGRFEFRARLSRNSL